MSVLTSTQTVSDSTNTYASANALLKNARSAREQRNDKGELVLFRAYSSPASPPLPLILLRKPIISKISLYRYMSTLEEIITLMCVMWYYHLPHPVFSHVIGTFSYRIHLPAIMRSQAVLSCKCSSNRFDLTSAPSDFSFQGSGVGLTGIFVKHADPTATVVIASEPPLCPLVRKNVDFNVPFPLWFMSTSVDNLICISYCYVFILVISYQSC